MRFYMCNACGQAYTIELVNELSFAELKVCPVCGEHKLQRVKSTSGALTIPPYSRVERALTELLYQAWRQLRRKRAQRNQPALYPLFIAYFQDCMDGVIEPSLDEDDDSAQAGGSA